MNEYENNEQYQENEINEIAQHASKKAVRTGGRLLKRGMRKIAKGVLKALFAILKALGPYIIIPLIILIVAYAVYYFVSEENIEDFATDLTINAPSTDTNNLIAYIDSLQEQDNMEIPRYLAEYDINLNVLKQYMILENDTVELDEETNVKLETTTTVTEGNRTNTRKKTTNNFSKITLEKTQASYPYRLYWQFLASLDIYQHTSHLSEELTEQKGIYKQVKKYLLPEYKWAETWIGNSKYTRDVTDKTETIKIYKTDGEVTSEVTTVEENKYTYPLAYLQTVKTGLGIYTFNYTEKITTVEHEWGEYIEDVGPVIEHSRIVGYEIEGYQQKLDPITGKLTNDYSKPIYDYDDPIYEEWTTQTITKTRYTKTKQVDENLLKGEPKFSLDLKPFTNFLLNTDIGPDELLEVYNVIVKLPNSYEAAEFLSIALNEYGLITDVAGYTFNAATPLNLDIDFPTIIGTYTREELASAAKSLLGVPYFWGGKHNKIGINSEWGSLKTVTSTGSWSTGKAIPYGLDCSGFISWAYNQILIPEGQMFPDGTRNQVASPLLTRINENQLKVGDIGYTKGIDHVGMYIGDVDNIPVFIHAGGRLYSSFGKPAGQVVLSYNNTNLYYEGNAPTKFINFYRLNYQFKGE